jgi:DNA replication and repair protein RecF
VRIDDLKLRHFRNLTHVELQPDPRFNVVVGPNGQGKTNLAEAVYVLSTLKSFRATRNAHLIQFEQDEARCIAMVDRAGVRREVDITLRQRSRKVTLNGNTIRKLADFFGTVNTVAFTPEDIAVLKGSPSERRLLLDRIVFHANPTYAIESGRYEEALKQRNAVLKNDRPDMALLEVYDEQLVPLGCTVVARRRAMVERLRAPFQEAFAEIFDAAIPVDLQYVPSFFAGVDTSGSYDAITQEMSARADDTNVVADELRAAFKRSRRADFARGFTTVGPHRDDLQTWLGGQPVKAFASQGQHRAFMLALKITEIRLLEQLLGAPPILVLDDVSSELDPVRNRKLFDFLSDFAGQVFITTTDLDYIKLSADYTPWKVSGGTITR